MTVFAILAHAGAASVLPKPTWAGILRSWTFEPPVMAVVVAAGALYASGVRRVRRRFPGAPWPRARTWWFFLGLAAIVISLESPIDAYSDDFLWVHMIEHILLMSVAAPLLLLGAPVTLALRAASPSVRRRWLNPILHSRAVRAISHPIVAWVLFNGAVVGTHFSPWYEAALVNQTLHDLEHLTYMVTALLFWWVAIARDPHPWHMSPPVRMLFVLVAAPVNTFVALAIYSANHVLYPHYAEVVRHWGPSPLADQHMGGAVMWIVGDLTLLVATVLLAIAWMHHDLAEARRIDERLERGRTALGEPAGDMVAQRPWFADADADPS